MTPEQALQQLYLATRSLPASADVHDKLIQFKNIIASALKKDE